MPIRTAQRLVLLPVLALLLSGSRPGAAETAETVLIRQVLEKIIN